jgi:hypothetical protein
MAEGRDRATGSSKWAWLELFRCFQIALDPRKLLAAAAGILAMSVGWYILSAIFFYKAPERSDPDYSNSTLQKKYEGKREDELVALGDREFQTDLEQWTQLADLAAPASPGSPATDKLPARAPTPPGRLRAMPWDEYRGPNPFLFATDVISGSAYERSEAISGFLSGSVPVLMEPLVKLLIPVSKIVSPGVSTLTRIYLFLVILWGLAVWGFFGGIITRLAAIQLANKGPVTFRQTIRFVATRYLNYLLAPMVPLLIVAAVTVGLCLYGLVGLLPVVGDLLLYGLGLPLVLIGGAIMAVFLIGLLGYPLMYPTLSVEGDSSDTFDALSRSINYVYQAPWQYLWYWLVAVLYGAAVTFFVLFFASLMVYVGKWAVGLPASALYSDRKPEFLFIHAPQSFGWKELLLKDSPYEVRHIPEITPRGRKVDVYVPVNPEANAAQRNDYYWYNTLGARMVSLWLGLVFLMMLGFSYSFFWTAATVIYFLLRKKIDEADPDEVFVEDDEPEAPLAPPKLSTPPTPAAPAAPSTSLTVIQSPPAPPPPPPPIPLASTSPPPVPPAIPPATSPPLPPPSTNGDTPA